MLRLLRAKRPRLLLLALAIGLLVGSAAWAAIPGPGGVITGCFKNVNGQLRVVNSSSNCRPSETALTWNQTGPAGPAGPQGPQGPAGPSGITKVTRLVTTAQDNFAPTDNDFHQRLTLGTFTKDAAATRVRALWQGPAWIEGGSTCTYQLRIDGKKDTGSVNPAYEPGEGGDSVLWLANGATFNENAIADTADFTGLAAGTHTITVWVRGVSNPSSCFINPGVFTMTVLVDEMP
jgi:hypothetical protein